MSLPAVSGEDSVYSDDEDYSEAGQRKLLQEMSTSSSGHDNSDSDDNENDCKSSKKHFSWICWWRKNCTKIAVIVFLWIACVLCSAAYSIINPFFPQVVSKNWA